MSISNPPLRDPLEGAAPDLDTLRNAADKVKAEGRYEPKVLVLSENAFYQLTNLVTLHGYSAWISTEYSKLGLERVVYADDVDDNEFILTSGKDLPAGIAEIVINAREASKAVR